MNLKKINLAWINKQQSYGLDSGELSVLSMELHPTCLKKKILSPKAQAQMHYDSNDSRPLADLNLGRAQTYCTQGL